MSPIVNQKIERIETFLKRPAPIWQTAAVVAFTQIAAIYLYCYWKRTDWKKMGAKLLLQLPFVANKLKAEKAKLAASLALSLFKKDEVVYAKLPEEGLTEEVIFSRYRDDPQHWKEGYMTGAVYDNDPKGAEVMLRAMQLSLRANPMHATAFANERKQKAEIVSMTASLFHAPDTVTGCVNPGGTFSLFMVCLAARERGKKLYGIHQPNIVAPVTVHAAIEKACGYLNIEFRPILLDPDSFEGDCAELEQTIDSNTVLVIGSAPNFPHGMIDPIKKFSDLAVKHKGRFGLHVDACLGSFVVPFLQCLQPFDFRLPGVTSISCDTHKYGKAVKGSSVLMYRDHEWMKHQYFISLNWPGGLYATQEIAGSQPGAIYAATYAMMLHTGRKGYAESAVRIQNTLFMMLEELDKIKEIQVIGRPQVCVFAFKASDAKLLNILNVGNRMKKRRWELSGLQKPDALHFCLTNIHAAEPKEFAVRFSTDLQACIKEELADPKKVKGDTAKMYGELQSIPKLFAEEMIEQYLEMVGRPFP